MRIYVNLLRGWVVFNVFVAIDTRGFRLPWCTLCSASTRLQNFTMFCSSKGVFLAVILLEIH